MTRKTLEVYATFVRESCDWSALSAGSNVGALDRPLVGFMSLQDHRAWKGDKLLARLDGNQLAPSFPTLKGWKKASPSFSRRPRPAAVWSELAVETCRVGCVLAVVLTVVMFEAYLRPGEVLSLKPSSFLAPTEGGVRSWVILLVLISGPQERNWRGGRYDQSRFIAMSVDGARVQKASAPAAAAQAVAQPELRRVLSVFPSCCRKS